MKLTDLIGIQLAGWSIENFFEMYTTDEDGKKVHSTGFVRNENVATAFIENQPDAVHHSTKGVLLLTDGKEGFLLGGSALILDEHVLAIELRDKIKSKLSAAERKLLNIE